MVNLLDELFELEFPIKCHFLYNEALNSLYSLFGTTREILKEAGSDVGASQNSVGGIAIATRSAITLIDIITHIFN